VSSADDGARGRDPIADRRTRISARFWQSMPQFQFVQQTPATRAAAMAPALGLLALWLVAVGGVFLFAARRLAGQAT
jgi:ABC-2 type transport system permease protein